MYAAEATFLGWLIAIVGMTDDTFIFARGPAESARDVVAYFLQVALRLHMSEQPGLSAEFLVHVLCTVRRGRSKAGKLVNAPCNGTKDNFVQQ